ncbi:hypothetical protein [Streptomyces sp. NBC_01481]|uniref:hypothetical protein n=1 Tax=Streptomyces sp. NBC_01481 TaxID=2975869 RepID=UPI0022578B06|nr:hypothetical protein [Streptomyces sp. NBC_01481]MCX4586368.1 hypothetical protein [Streptomyces sp. NBC_01481]
MQLQEVPFAPSSDAAGELDVSAGWDDERLVAGYVERVLGRIEAHAPGLRALVTRWSAVSPAGSPRPTATPSAATPTAAPPSSTTT